MVQHLVVLAEKFGLYPGGWWQSAGRDYLLPVIRGGHWCSEKSGKLVGATQHMQRAAERGGVCRTGGGFLSLPGSSFLLA